MRFKRPPTWLQRKLAEQSPATLKVRARGRELPGHQRGQMNSSERTYAAELDAQKSAGLIVAYWFESVTLTVAEPPNAAVVRWTADFVVMDADGYLTFVDVKGTRPQDEQGQRVKIKAAAERYTCFRFVVARQRPKRDGGGFSIEII